MNFDNFLEACERMGLDPFSYLTPSDAFRKIKDNVEYETGDIALYLDVTPRHVRRILYKGNANLISIRPFKCLGIEAKRAIFNYYYKYILRDFPIKNN